MTVPEIDPKSGAVMKHEGRKRECDMDEFIDLVDSFSEYYPRDPLFMVMMRLFGSVCPTAIGEADPYLNYWISMENFCTEYHVLPFDGAALDQPMDVIEVFNVIRGIRNEYQWRQAQEHLEEARRLAAK